MARRATRVIIEPDEGGGEERQPQKRQGRREQTNTFANAQDLSELQDMIQQAGDVGANAKVSLYREDRSGTQTVNQFLEDLPACPASYAEVGERHGGGRFALFSRWKIPDTGAWHVVSHRFILASRFDAIARANAAQPFDAAMPGTVPAPVVRAAQAEIVRAPMADMLELVKAIVSVVAPLIKPQRDPLEMIQVIAGMGQTMFKSQLDHAEDYSRRIMDMAEAKVGVEAEPEQPPRVEDLAPKDPVMAMMLEALKTIVPMFRRAPEQEARAVAAPLAQRPDVKGLIGNIKRRQRMMVELRKEYDEQEVARLCRIFNVPYSAPAAPVAAPAVDPQDREDAGEVEPQPVPFVQQDLFQQPPASGAGAGDVQEVRAE